MSSLKDRLEQIRILMNWSKGQISEAMGYEKSSAYTAILNDKIKNNIDHIRFVKLVEILNRDPRCKNVSIQWLEDGVGESFLSVNTNTIVGESDAPYSTHSQHNHQQNISSATLREVERLLYMEKGKVEVYKEELHKHLIEHDAKTESYMNAINGSLQVLVDMFKSVLTVNPAFKESIGEPVDRTERQSKPIQTDIHKSVAKKHTREQR